MMRLSSICRPLALVGLAVCLLGLTPHAAQADSPAEKVVRHFYGQLLGAMKQGEQLGFDGRRDKLAPVIKASFDLPDMARNAVGSSWSEASSQDRDALVSAFTDFSVASYAAQFASYDGQSFDVTGEHAAPAAGGVIVETAMRPQEGNAVELNYLMRPDSAGNYKIVDVFVNGTISEMATRRAEFSSVARSDGIPALAHSLDEKSKELGST